MPRKKKVVKKEQKQKQKQSISIRIDNSRKSVARGGGRSRERPSQPVPPPPIVVQSSVPQFSHQPTAHVEGLLRRIQQLETVKNNTVPTVVQKEEIVPKEAIKTPEEKPQLVSAAETPVVETPIMPDSVGNKRATRATRMPFAEVVGDLPRGKFAIDEVVGTERDEDIVPVREFRRPREFETPPLPPPAQPRSVIRLEKQRQREALQKLPFEEVKERAESFGIRIGRKGRERLIQETVDEMMTNRPIE